MSSKRCAMKRRISFLGMAMAAVVLLALQSISRPVEHPQSRTDESIHDLNFRIQKLETQVAAMQKQIDDLESRSRPAPVIPHSHQMPPGAKPFYFNGRQYWSIPVTPDQLIRPPYSSSERK
jgi:hypothetical protein